MALLRSARNRSRLLSRGLVALLLVGVAVFALYLVGPFGGDDDAVAQAEPVAEQPVEPTPTPTLVPVDAPEAVPSTVVRTVTPSRNRPLSNDWNLSAEEPGGADDEPEAQVAAMEQPAIEPPAEPYVPPDRPV